MTNTRRNVPQPGISEHFLIYCPSIVLPINLQEDLQHDHPWDQCGPRASCGSVHGYAPKTASAKTHPQFHRYG
jgi:hypothetical protein